MNLDQLRRECSIRGKNGISFLLSGWVLWLVYGMVYRQALDVQIKNAILLMLTGLLFPLAIGFSRLIRADWKLQGHPLRGLGFILNLAQFIYFPLVFWTLIDDPDKMLMVFAVITGAHFFPYGWFYQARGYYVMAPIMSLVVMIIGWNVDSSMLWMIPAAMTLLLIILIVWLWVDYKRKVA